jgi:hypothetical protein
MLEFLLFVVFKAEFPSPQLSILPFIQHENCLFLSLQVWPFGFYRNPFSQGFQEFFWFEDFYNRPVDYHNLKCPLPILG